MNLREMTREELLEEALIDLAYAILEDKKSAISFNDLVAEFQKLTGLTYEELKPRLVQFYTDLNFDGRFLLNQEAGWGLREWYKIETIEEETAPTVKARKKKAKVVDDVEEIEIEEEVGFDEEFEEFVEEDDDEDEEDDTITIVADEDLDFVEEEIEEIDGDIAEDLIVEEDDEFLIEEDDDEEEEFEEK